MQPGQLQRGTELRLKAEEPVFSSTGGSAHGAEGVSLARHDGFVFFVVGAVPGDEVLAQVVRLKKNFAEAKVIQIERPSPFRTDPRCEHFGVCGGCKWQHVQYQAQLRFKEKFVRDSIERIGGFKEPLLLPMIGAENEYFYRNKMEFSFSDQQWSEVRPERMPVKQETGLFLGLHVPQRYDKILDVRECHLQSKESNRILTITRDFFRSRNIGAYSSQDHSGYLRFLVVRQSQRTRDLMVNLVTHDDRPDVVRQYVETLLREIPEVTTVVNTINSRRAQVAYGEKEKVYHGPGIIREKFKEFTFSISAGSFFQTNTPQAEKLYEAATSLADLQRDDVVYDFYSGTGTIAIYVAKNVQHVVGFDSSLSATGDAERNAKENGIDNCTFIAGDLREQLLRDADWKRLYPSPDVIIADPPRSGMHPEVVEEIIRLSPKRLVYISCNPATQARDLTALCRKRFELIKCQPVDMFPHTYHVENIALLQLKTA